MGHLDQPIHMWIHYENDWAGHAESLQHAQEAGGNPEQYDGADDEHHRMLQGWLQRTEEDGDHSLPQFSECRCVQLKRVRRDWVLELQAWNGKQLGSHCAQSNALPLPILASGSIPSPVQSDYHWPTPSQLDELFLDGAQRPSRYALQH